MTVLGNPGNRRVQMFARAFDAAGGGTLEIVAWNDYLHGNRGRLQEALSPGCTLRIDSPGEDFAVEKALLMLGARENVEPCYNSMEAGEVKALEFRKGCILPMRQWFLGWKHVLAAIESDAAGCRFMNAPAEIAVMFDKAACHATLEAAKVEKPALLGIPGSYEELRAMMEKARQRRVFLKPCHSSSASGVVALETNAHRAQAFTTVECVEEAGAKMLFNSLRVRRLTEEREIVALVDAICRERCIAEAWFAKAGLDGLRFDLRVLVINGIPAHTVMRQSTGPMTNLHLGNRRGDLAALQARMGGGNWMAAMSVCQRAAAAFPRSFCVGVDLLVSPGFDRFAVAEVNAFGDLLPNLLHHGLDTYSLELARWRQA